MSRGGNKKRIFFKLWKFSSDLFRQAHQSRVSVINLDLLKLPCLHALNGSNLSGQFRLGGNVSLELVP